MARKPVLYKDNSKPKNLLEALQTAVIGRYLRSQPTSEPIIYEFTQDRALLHQYYRLREMMYRKIYNSRDIKADEDLHDKLSYILIARRGNLCLGGCRLTVREGDEMWDLPMETDAFKLRDKFSELPLQHVRHGEISRFAIMEDAGDEDIFHGMCKVMYEKVVSLHIHYLFAKSIYSLARNWRLIANSMGVKTTRIRDDIEVPSPPFLDEIKWYVTLSDLSVLHPAPEAQPAQFEAAIEKTAEKARLALID